MDEKILTPDQVALILQVHPFTVLKFIKQGKLRASKLGRVYRIRQSDVGRFLDEGEATSAKAPSAVKEAAEAPPTHTKNRPAPKSNSNQGSNHQAQGDESVKEAEASRPEPQLHSESKNNQQSAKQEHVDHYILD